MPGFVRRVSPSGFARDLPRFGGLVAVLCTVAAAQVRKTIDFNRDVRPILADRCFACHGPDGGSRKAGLRLDTRDGATAPLPKSGRVAVYPGDPGRSELIARVEDRGERRMPPRSSHKSALSRADVATLRQWIVEGANWEAHWSFQRPRVRVSIPDGVHPVDFFIERKLRAAGLDWSAAATTHTLRRRLALDLTGLPPPDRLADARIDGHHYSAYVDRLLGSPRYGERMAMWWLDRARYSDTDGFQQDAVRTVWPWRDWVIDSFNNNRPFDQFTRWQIAGDLLPDATAEQRLATCFHRNHMTNGEGGRDPAESRIDYVLDRTNTTGRVWLGLTVGCAQCHDHKFDPISQVDYYRLAAYFDNIDESGRAGAQAKPYLQYSSPRGAMALARAEKALLRERRARDRVVAAAQPAFEKFVRGAIERARGDYRAWRPLVFESVQSIEGAELVATGAVVVADTRDLPHDDFVLVTRSPRVERISGLRLEILTHPSHSEGRYTNGPGGDFVLTNVKVRVRDTGSSQVREVRLRGVVADLERSVRGESIGPVLGVLDDDPRTGWTTHGLAPDPKVALDYDGDRVAVFELEHPLRLQPHERLEIWMLHRSVRLRAITGRFRWSVTDERAGAVRSLASTPLQALADELERAASFAGPVAADRVPTLSAGSRSRLFEQFALDHEPLVAAQARLRAFRRQRDEARRHAKPVSVPVLAERANRRQTHVLERGVWDQRGDAVAPGVPAAVLRRDVAPGRLELAEWLVASDNPLTARVVVNQFWQMLFGHGLVRTPGDFGQQGEPPTHPELLDWLALDFIDSGWDVQHLLRRLVTSRTYRQSSATTPDRIARDPDNRLWARGSRFRLPSWMIRDSMLQASGLLVERVGGPPVFPHQPAGVWADQFMGRIHYRPTLGSDQFRRSLYAFWRRTSAPTFLFDVASRRECEMAPRRTNTPLHALTMWNDQTAVAAARGLARRFAEAEDVGTYARSIGRAVLGRDLAPAEVDTLRRLWDRCLDRYFEAPDLACQLIGEPVPWVDALERPAASAVAAARVVLANAMLNLDEAMTRE